MALEYHHQCSAKLNQTEQPRVAVTVHTVSVNIDAARVRIMVALLSGFSDEPERTR
ncbi:MAG TPA: hypothetical protein VJW17_03830 [Pyrinomonadaceae bacterium]|nr:hypothetical protein [Pyrinomonadaceae bacterium]